MSTYTTKIQQDNKTLELLFGQDPVLNRLFMVLQETDECGGNIIYSNLEDEHLDKNPDDYQSIDYFANKLKELGYVFPQHLYDHLSTTEVRDRTPAQAELFDKYVKMAEEYLLANDNNLIYYVPYETIEGISMVDVEFHAGSVIEQSEHNFGVPRELMALAIGEVVTDTWVFDQIFDAKYKRLHGEIPTTQSIIAALKKLQEIGNYQFNNLISSDK